MQQVLAPLNPHWQPHQASQNLYGVRKGIGPLLAQCEALSADVDPLTELTALIDTRKANLTQQRQDWAGLQSSFSGGSGHAAFFSASDSQALANMLTVSAPPSPDSPLAVLVLLAGPTGSVNAYKEILGL